MHVAHTHPCTALIATCHPHHGRRSQHPTVAQRKSKIKASETSAQKVQEDAWDEMWMRATRRNLNPSIAVMRRGIAGAGGHTVAPGHGRALLPHSATFWLSSTVFEFETFSSKNGPGRSVIVESSVVTHCVGHAVHKVVATEPPEQLFRCRCLGKLCFHSCIELAPPHVHLSQRNCGWGGCLLWCGPTPFAQRERGARQ